jgi:hypothetical protein
MMIGPSKPPTDPRRSGPFLDLGCASAILVLSIEISILKVSHKDAQKVNTKSINKAS